MVVPQAGITLPTLNTSTAGNYGGFIILSEVSYSYSSGWASAISTDQFNQLYAYQNTFGVRMVRLDVYPGSDFGATALGGCCGSDVEQLISISDDTHFPTANIVTGPSAGMTTEGLWHYPATITDSSTTTEIAQFAPSSDGTYAETSTAAVINNFKGRQQMVFFTSWATQWSGTSAFLQHSYIHWMTRGLFVGARKTYLNTQVDDVHLKTLLYTPSSTTFRIQPADLDNHVSWLADINTRLPSGSKYFMELGHNGNGDIANATTQTNSVCSPDTAIYYSMPPATDLEFQKPLGTGTDFWPTTPTSYAWSVACAQLDQLASWFMTSTNRDAFSHISHTFSHLNLDNATYNDVNREMFFNIAWLTQVGISAGKFSSKGLIPPAITGMHNGDAIDAWMKNGVTTVVGDNSRSVLLNQQNEHWPLISTVASNGYAGLNIMPRWPTNIYYDCDLPACTAQEWADLSSAGSDNFTALIANEKSVSTKYLFSLRHDPFMFHQANLRAADVPSTTVGSANVYSLLQIWVETVTQEMARMTKWPIVTLKHDDIAQQFANRMARDGCDPNLAYSYSVDGTQITGATVTSSNGNTCSVPIPVTFPGSATASGASVTSDQVGSEPLIMWATLSGSPVVFTLASPITL